MITSADRRRALVDSARLTRGLWPRAWVSIALGTGAILAAGALLAVSGWLISRAAQQPPILLLGVAIVGVRFFGISRAVLRYAERLVSHDLAFRALTDLRQRFFARLVPLIPGAMPGRADLLSRFVADADRLQDLYLRAINPPLISLFAGAAAVIASAVILPVAGLVIAVALLIGGVGVPALTAAIAGRAGRNQATARATLATRMVEVVEGAPEIALAGREADFEESVGSASLGLTSILRRDAVAGGVAVGSSAAVGAAAAVAMVAVAVAATSAGAVNGIMIASLVLIALATIEVTSPLGAAAASIEAVGDAAARLEQVTEHPAPVAVAEHPVSIPAGGSLAMEGVRFSYSEDRPLLDDFDLEVRPGEAVALSGPSGAGKSTVADLLVRFLDPVAGSVRLGGVDLRDLDPDQLREHVRLAPQDAYLFSTSIRANVVIGKPGAGDEEILRALDRVGLGGWLTTLPDGLDTDVGDAGAQVSGGQRQRLAMARAVVSGAAFCIFDEPTSHVDPDGALELLGQLAALAHRDGRGVLAITHESRGLDGFDRVLELRPSGPSQRDGGRAR